MLRSKLFLSRLLAGRNRLGRLEKEQILERVLAETAPRRRSRWWFAALPAIAAVVALVLVVMPWQRGSERGELAARGAGTAFGAFKPACARGCAAGDKIVFDFHGTTGYRYFAAFSQRADGTVLWYFPSSDTEVSIDLAQQTGGVIQRGIVIGSEHSAGTYRVFGVFSNEPLSRAQIRERFDRTRVTAGPGTTVIEQELVVQ